MITLDFSKSRSAVSGKLYQYDYGQVLRCEGIDSTETGDAPELHFAYQEEGPSVARIGVLVDDGIQCVIPNAMLINAHTRDDYSLYVYLYTGNAETGLTLYKGRIPVVSRPEVSEPEEEDLYPQAMYETVSALIQDSLDAAQQAADSASASATDAQQAVTDAAAEVTKAEGEAAKAAASAAEAEAISEGLEGRIRAAVAEEVPGAVADYLEEHPVSYDDTELRGLVAQAQNTANAADTAAATAQTTADDAASAADAAQDTADEALSVANQSAAGVRNLDTRTTALESSVATLQTDEAALALRMTTAEGDIDTLEAGQTALDGRVTTAEGTLTSQGARITTLEGAGYQTAAQVQALIDASVTAALSASY